MKYIKTYEIAQLGPIVTINSWTGEIESFKKFVVDEFITKYNYILQIWEILNYTEESNNFTILKKYEYTPEDGLKETSEVPFYFSRSGMYKDTIYQTNTIEDALEFVNMKIESIKYNL